MTRFNNYGPSGERYRPRTLTPSEKLEPLPEETSEAFEERRKNRRALEIMESYNKTAAEKEKAGEPLEPKVMTYQMARKIIDDSAAEVTDALEEARRRKPKGRIREVLSKVLLDRAAQKPKDTDI